VVAKIVSAGASKVDNITINIPTAGKKFNQLSQRGWSNDTIEELVSNPYIKRTSTNRATGNSATVYYRKDGHYIIRDDITGDLVQMSNTNAQKWIPDSNIINPYIP
jgi:hypothetical protein